MNGYVANGDVTDFDVGIVGGGPAGLSAAIMLGRACRQVVLIDHGMPRNAQAIVVNGYLGIDECSPHQLRERGTRAAESFGVRTVRDKVVAAYSRDQHSGIFELRLNGGQSIAVSKLLLATGVTDLIPEIAGIEDFYGRSVHHCPYCGGWEHRDKRLVALADGDSVLDLAATLLSWSPRVMACTNGAAVPESHRHELSALGVSLRTERLLRLSGDDAKLARIVFDAGPSLDCDALFFSAGQRQTSRLYESLGCECNDKGKVVTDKKHSTHRRGLFVAGDANGDVQLAIVAAAEGAMAAIAINAELIEDMRASASRKLPKV
jgi:thioredoxin reductase